MFYYILIKCGHVFTLPVEHCPAQCQRLDFPCPGCRNSEAQFFHFQHVTVERSFCGRILQHVIDSLQGYIRLIFVTVIFPLSYSSFCYDTRGRDLFVDFQWPVAPAFSCPIPLHVSKIQRVKSSRLSGGKRLDKIPPPTIRLQDGPVDFHRFLTFTHTHAFFYTNRIERQTKRYRVVFFSKLFFSCQ